MVLVISVLFVAVLVLIVVVVVKIRTIVLGVVVAAVAARLAVAAVAAIGLRERTDLVAQDAADRAHRRHVVLVAYALVKQLVAYLPGEDARIALLVLAYLADHLGRGDARLAAADGARQDAARLLVAREYLAHAAVRDAQLARDVARPDAQVGHLHNAHADRVGQRTAVDEHAAQLVHLAVRHTVRV